MFAFVHTVGKRCVEALCTAVDNNRVVARIHGSFVAAGVPLRVQICTLVGFC